MLHYPEDYFASNFHTPELPESINAEYQASFIQHNWDGYGISQVSTGPIYASPSMKRLRLDTSSRNIIGSSLLDYEKKNSDGTIPNYV